MNRIIKAFSVKGDKVIPYITAGYPSKDATVEMILAAESAGAAMIELGMPFSDPLADGPIIQKASQIAIGNGVTISWILSIVLEARKKTDIPIVLMGYINPVFKYGLKKFIIDAKNCGVDGLIIPDLPIDEASNYISYAKKYEISPILLVAPNTSKKRIKKISKLATDLIYCVAILGVTGAAYDNDKSYISYLKSVRSESSCPFIVGFGIKNRREVKEINKFADGAVIGSALIKAIENANDPISTVYSFINKLTI